MKFFLDTEFIEGFHKPLLGKRRHFIDLVSIGIVTETGHCYNAINSAYEYNKASQWVKKNVIRPLYSSIVHGDARNRWGSNDFHRFYGLPEKMIADEILAFIKQEQDGNYIRFYGYFSDYDWVLFCSLFGTMMDLPEGFPMFCIDLKQMADEKFEQYWEIYSDHGRVFNKQKIREEWQNANYPVQTNEHDALADAKWNLELYKRIVCS
jgi:3' exoribonuclease, RNase T-like